MHCPAAGEHGISSRSQLGSASPCRSQLALSSSANGAPSRGAFGSSESTGRNVGSSSPPGEPQGLEEPGRQGPGSGSTASAVPRGLVVDGPCQGQRRHRLMQRVPSKQTSRTPFFDALHRFAAKRHHGCGPWPPRKEPSRVSAGLFTSEARPSVKSPPSCGLVEQDPRAMPGDLRCAESFRPRPVHAPPRSGAWRRSCSPDPSSGRAADGRADAPWSDRA